jgi:hypothetical protein
MHFSVFVFTPPVAPELSADDGYKKVMADIEAALAPYREDENGGEWDWFQIGGRFTGTFDGYDPDKDPSNYKPCSYCEATGVRKDMRIRTELGEPSCNVCRGTGKAPLWPTQWKQRVQDTVTVGQLRRLLEAPPEGFGSYAAVIDGAWREGVAKNADLVRALIEGRDPREFVTVVDCHV